MKRLEFTFNDDSLRLDTAIQKLIPHLSRSKIQTLKHTLFVNKKIAKFSQKLKRGDAVVFEYKDETNPSNTAENIALDIIYEDEDVIVINKKRGMVVHPAPLCVKGTLLNALNYYRINGSKFQDEFSKIYSNDAQLIDAIPQSERDILRLGIVHRLDRETSGVIVTARNIKTQMFLKNEFKQKRVKKIYLALLEGHLKENEGEIKTSIFRSKNKKGCFASSSNLKKGRIAISRYKVLKKFGEISLVRFRIYTGRTHQIRVHARKMGASILGDVLYGKKRAKNKIKEGVSSGSLPFYLPLCLHAYKIELNIKEGVRKTFIAPLPDEFKRILRIIKK